MPRPDAAAAALLARFIEPSVWCCFSLYFFSQGHQTWNIIAPHKGGNNFAQSTFFPSLVASVSGKSAGRTGNNRNRKLPLPLLFSISNWTWCPHCGGRTPFAPVSFFYSPETYSILYGSRIDLYLWATSEVASSVLWALLSLPLKRGQTVLWVEA